MKSGGKNEKKEPVLVKGKDTTTRGEAKAMSQRECNNMLAE